MTALTASDQKEIQSQVEQAKLVIAKNGYHVSAIVNFHKLTPRAKKKSFGFNFDQTKSVGDKWTDEHGISWEAVAIVTP